MAPLSDPRAEAYAKLLVERCLDVQAGMQVVIRTTPLARPLLEATTRAIARRGAYAIVRMNWTLWPPDVIWAGEAPEAIAGELPEVERYACEHMDARITIDAPENTRAAADLGAARRALMRRYELPFFALTHTDRIPWVGCQYPTPALAQEAGMTLREFADFLYGACLLDWDAEGERLRRHAARFDAADEVRIVGEGTDLRLSLKGRRAKVDDGRNNMPGGEFFYAPVEDSAEGVITFDVPSLYEGRAVEGIRLVFAAGRVVEGSAAVGEDALLAALDRDEGARRLGELGVGCNPAIRRPMRNTLFDEKMDGTVHLALGQSYTAIGGQNRSAIHWDIVKDLRRGGRIELDGKVVQEDGRWLD